MSGRHNGATTSGPIGQHVGYSPDGTGNGHKYKQPGNDRNCFCQHMRDGEKGPACPNGPKCVEVPIPKPSDIR